MEKLKKFDTEEVKAFVFHPRKHISPDSHIKRLHIPVEKDINIGASFFEAEKDAPFILYFHGNGEIVSDYDDLGPLFVEMNINFMPVDYRGYGFSDGSPSLVGMMTDALKIGDFVFDFKKQEGFTGPFAVMGRSLGSASALELAHKKQFFDALIIESGFSDFIYLLQTIGYFNQSLKNALDPFDHAKKIAGIQTPLLVIHGQNDQIIRFREGRELFNSSPAEWKKLVKIEKAGHNTIFTHGMELYFSGIKELFDNL